jgi:hypothetical protein
MMKNRESGTSIRKRDKGKEGEVHRGPTVPATPGPRASTEGPNNGQSGP